MQQQILYKYVTLKPTTKWDESDQGFTFTWYTAYVHLELPCLYFGSPKNDVPLLYDFTNHTIFVLDILRILVSVWFCQGVQTKLDFSARRLVLWVQLWDGMMNN